ncbi:MAG: helix-turn-helix domain-containing protein [Enterocloster asparagiformis]|nr:helix-turn-helix domain-containing protein [Enterocloster asparagiformis]
MPKIKPLEIEARRRVVRACVASKRELNGWSDEQAAARCRVSTQTLRRRLERPEEFTLQELWDLGLVVYLYDGQSQLPDTTGTVELSGRR